MGKKDFSVLEKKDCWVTLNQNSKNENLKERWEYNIQRDMGKNALIDWFYVNVVEPEINYL